MILQSVFAFADEVNKYIDETKPWTLKDDSEETQKKLKNILFTIGRALEEMGNILTPFFPEKMTEMLTRIG
jgi:methionyl-tRNA synthetase